jgi:hypothetical protein
MRTRAQLVGIAMGVTLSCGAFSPAAHAASTGTAPPMTSLQVCTTFPAQIVAQQLGKHTTPSAAYYPSKQTSAGSYATCFYRFSKLYTANVELYGPPRPVADLSGSKVPVLGPTGRLEISPPDTLVTVLSHGYEITIVGQTAFFSRSSLIALAVYVTRHVPSARREPG